jgi:hypothetical protein
MAREFDWMKSGYWLPDHTLLSEEQLARCARAYDADGGEPLPVPTRMVSNGEYMPIPQTENQKRVEAKLNELADHASKKLGVSRRQFLRSSGGTAAAFLAMNTVFGRFFKVEAAEMYEDGARAANGPPRSLFVVDDQLHFVRGSRTDVALTLRALAQGPSTPGFTSNPFNPNGLPDEFGNPWGVWNPKLVGLPITNDMFHILEFIKTIYFDSQVTVGLISNVTAFVAGQGSPNPGQPALNVEDARTGEILTAAQTAAARDFINQLAGSRRAMAHGLLYVGKGNLDYIQYQADHHRPDAWKGYTISPAAKVDSGPMVQWRQDDEAVAYPTYEVIMKNLARARRNGHHGFNNICVHKGLASGLKPLPQNGHPSDLPKACRDWPGLNFVTYHSCIQDSFFDAAALAAIRAAEAGKPGSTREGVPDIPWTTEFALLTRPFRNSYAEIGTTFASSVVTFPTVTAHILGQLLKFKGKNHILFGSDSLWYGSPQWQIEAMWRFQIPESIRERWGYPALTESAKRHILGLNAGRIYGLPAGAVNEKGGGREDDDDRAANEKSGFGGREDDDDRAVYRPVPADYARRMPEDLKKLLEFPGYPPNQTADNLSRAKERYAAMGVEASHTRYGWVRSS